MWRTGRLLALIVLAGVLGTLVASVPAGPASASDEGDEWAFVALVNQARSDAGLAPLGVLGSLQDLGRAQSGRMAEQHRLFHDPNLADALAGGPLAAVNGGPVLLTPPDAVPPDELAEARRVLRPGGTVFLLGGERALSPAIEAAFTTAGLTVRRVAGADRYETAVEVA